MNSKSCKPAHTSTSYYKKRRTEDHIAHVCPIEGCFWSTPYSKRHLQNHMYSKHTAEKDRPFQCKYHGCKRGFVQKSHLKRHNENVHGLLPEEEILWIPEKVRRCELTN